MNKQIIVNTVKELHDVMGELIILGYLDCSDDIWNGLIESDLNSGEFKNGIAVHINEKAQNILPVHFLDSDDTQIVSLADFKLSKTDSL